MKPDLTEEQKRIVIEKLVKTRKRFNVKRATVQKAFAIYIAPRLAQNPELFC